MEGFYIVLFLGIVVGLIFLARLLGAWMLRIDEVILILKEILKQLKMLNDNK